MKISKKDRRVRRALKARTHIRQLGVARLTIHRTPRHIYAQVFDADGALLGDSPAVAALEQRGAHFLPAFPAPLTTQGRMTSKITSYLPCRPCGG